MKLDDLLKQTSGWLKGTGPHSEIVISSRVRLARNIEKMIFSNWATNEQLEQAFAIIEALQPDTNNPVRNHSSQNSFT